MVINTGRQIQFINGINGVAAGGNSIVNMDVNKRYHRNVLQFTAVNYTGATGAAITKIVSSAGAGATGTLTIVNGVPTAIAIVAGGTGWTIGDTFTIADSTGTGFVGTVATVTGGPPGAIATATVTTAGTPSPVNPVTACASLQQVVNGVIIRDISVDSILRITNANNNFPTLGELPLYYTDPSDNVNQLNELTSWDMFGQSTFAVRAQIAATVTNPGLNGFSEFDYARNARPTPTGMQPFLQPVAMHEFTFSNLAAGLNKINTIPFDYPIRRMWFLGSTPGNITQLEVYQDSNKVFEATTAMMKQAYEDYGFQFGSTVPTKTPINTPRYWDFAYISDPDKRIGKALTCENSLVLRLTTAISQSVTIAVEYLPGQYAS
jgi:hypothetical protein